MEASTRGLEPIDMMRLRKPSSNSPTTASDKERMFKTLQTHEVQVPYSIRGMGDRYWRAALLPGVFELPSGVLGVAKAQEAGCTYCFAG